MKIPLRSSVSLLLFHLCGTLSQNAFSDESLQPHAVLLAQVSDYVTQQAAARYPDADIDVRMNPLDSRVRLPMCSSLDTQLQNERKFGRVAVAVSCRSPIPWKIFLTGEVRVALPVVVSRGAISRQSEIQADQVELQKRDIAKLRSRYLTTLESVVGWETRKDVAADQVFYAQQLQPARLVKKGDRVQITARYKQVRIRTNGMALSDGVRGQQIAVRNQHSQRIVHGWVSAPGEVSTQP